MMRVTLDHKPNHFRSPVSIWVHRQPPGKWWWDTKREDLDPPMPRRVAGKGFPVWTLEHRGRSLYFASPEEIAHAVDVLGQRVLPRPRDLGAKLGLINQHWLSRLHKSWRPWPVRQHMVKALAPHAARA